SPVNIPQIISSNLNPEEEWYKIQNMLNLGIIPSTQRLKEYLQVYCQGNNNIEEGIQKVLVCIADILRLQEERALSTDLELKNLLVLVESGK
ncbi:MAG: hypothetical protein NC909_00930, partial [Candidatus Omnitrophica bacterium]|nr:hypothetical protein [Candidatus Omnitrophota bacterium]